MSNTAQSLRLLLGFSPGSASDQVARLLAPSLAQRLGCGVYIESRLGCNGADAAAEAARSAPDGRTLFVATLGTHALAPNLGQPPPYDPIEDFAPISLLSRAPMLLACFSGLPVSSVRELIELARAQPGALTYATSAIGGAPHLAAELFQTLAGIELRHVRYDHTEKLYADLERGVVALSFNNIMSMLPRCRAGSLRSLGVSSATPSPVALDVPTIESSGLPGYEVYNWLGLVAPRATPPTLVAKLSKTIGDALRSENVAGPLEAAGVEPNACTPAEFARFLRNEIRRWGPVVSQFRQ